MNLFYGIIWFHAWKRMEFHVALDPEHESEILPKQNLHLVNELSDVCYCEKLSQKIFIFS